MIDVIKRDGSRQAFSEEKLRKSIEAAGKEARTPDQRLKQVVDAAVREALSLSREGHAVATKAIREKVLTRLDVTEPAVSAAWRAFDTKKG